MSENLHAEYGQIMLSKVYKCDYFRTTPWGLSRQVPTMKGWPMSGDYIPGASGTLNAGRLRFDTQDDALNLLASRLKTVAAGPERGASPVPMTISSTGAIFTSPSNVPPFPTRSTSSSFRKSLQWRLPILLGPVILPLVAEAYLNGAAVERYSKDALVFIRAREASERVEFCVPSVMCIKLAEGKITNRD